MMSASDVSRDAGQRLFAIAILIALNAFFVATEFSIVAVRRSRINQLVLEGDLEAHTVQRLQRGLARLLSTTQLGITLSSLALGWVGKETMGQLVSWTIMGLPLPREWQEHLTQTWSIPIAFLLIVYLQLVFGELLPKSLALAQPEQLSRLLGPWGEAIARVFKPLVWGINQSLRAILGLLGIAEVETVLNSRMTTQELQMIINNASEFSGLRAEEQRLLSNVLDFAGVSVGEVMIPRPAIATVAASITWGEFQQILGSNYYEAYPVEGSSLDEIQGLMSFRAIAAALAHEELDPSTPLTPWIEPVQFVPEYMLVSELVPLMRRQQQRIVIVVDEYGGTAGLVSWGDLVAEIFGDAPDAPAMGEEQISRLGNETYMIQAQVELWDANQAIAGLDLPLSEDYNTLGGFLIQQWQRVPQPGESLQYGCWEFTVVSRTGPRLNCIQTKRLPL